MIRYAATFLAIVVVITGVALADPPTTAPAADNPGDSEAQAQVRAARLKDDVDCFTRTLAQTRARMYTTTDAESDYADYSAHESWQADALEKVVRDKWGADGDVAFIQFFGGTTLEQDKTSEITIDGDHAVVADPFGKNYPYRMIKVKGEWLHDIHADFVATSADIPGFDRARCYRAPVMKQLTEDVKAGKYDDLDAFLTDLKDKMSSVPVTQLDN